MTSPDSENTPDLPSAAVDSQAVARALASDLQPPVADLYDLLGKLIGNGNIPEEHAEPLRKALDAVALTAQRAEILGNSPDVGSTGSMLYLDDVFGNALDDFGGPFAVHGVYARSSLKPARVMARPELLKQWAHLVIGWGMESGKNIGFKIDMPGMPAQAMVIVRIFMVPGTTALDVARAGEDTLGWLALQHASRSLGLPPLQRSLEPDGWLLRVDFPPVENIPLNR